MPKPNTWMDILVGDVHDGHKSGLCHPDMPDGVTQNKEQRWLYEVYASHFLPELKEYIKLHKPTTKHVVYGGDMVERDWKSRNKENEMWSRDYRETVPNAIELLKPITSLADYIHVIKGNQAHSGQSGEADELFAYALPYEKVVKNSGNKWIHNTAYWKAEGLLFQAKHKGKNYSKKNIDSIIASLRSDIVMECHRKGQPVPDVAYRFHNHWAGISSDWEKPIIVQNPSWQLPYEWVNEIDDIGQTPVVGATAFVYSGGKLIDKRKFTYTWERYVWMPK